MLSLEGVCDAINMNKKQSGRLLYPPKCFQAVVAAPRLKKHFAHSSLCDWLHYRSCVY